MRGFTLLEMLVALSIFALIAAIAYATIEPAGQGFRTLREERSRRQWEWGLEFRLRQDVDYLARSQDKGVPALVIRHELRGGDAYDQLWLLVAEAGIPALVRVHWFLDEEKGVLVRESFSPWRRPGVKALRWNLGRAHAFEVQALDAGNRWRVGWDSGSDSLPRALRVRWRNKDGGHELLLPLFLDRSTGA